jgi:hypothetical protein
VVELSSSSYFQNNVDVGGIVETAIQFDDVGVIEEHLDFNFSDELIGYLLFME